MVASARHAAAVLLALVVSAPMRLSAQTVTVDTVGENQRGEIVCEFRRKVLVPKRPA